MRLGAGSLGDIGCHILDPVFAALDLKYPASVEGCISTYYKFLFKYTVPKNETYPRSTIVQYVAPARKNFAALNLTWWDGGLMPARPDDMEPDRKLGDEDGGVLLIGDRATLMAGCYGRSPRLVPEARMKDFRPPAKTLDRVPNGEDGHEQDWIRACKGGKPASSNFDYSGPLSEMVLMGNLAVRFPDPEAPVGRRSHQPRPVGHRNHLEARPRVGHVGVRPRVHVTPSSQTRRRSALRRRAVVPHPGHDRAVLFPHERGLDAAQAHDRAAGAPRRTVVVRDGHQGDVVGVAVERQQEPPPGRRRTWVRGIQPRRL